MKKFTVIASLVVTAFTFNAQSKDNNFVPDAKDTALNGLFTNVSTDDSWPKLAVTFLNFFGDDCANLKATIWHSESRKEIIPSFKVCTDKNSAGGAKGAMFMGDIENQISVMNNTGNKRTEGPYSPMTPLPFKYLPGIVVQVAHITKWDGSQLETNLWFVNEMK